MLRARLPRGLWLAFSLLLLATLAPAQHPPRSHPPVGMGLRHLTRVPPEQRETKVRQSPAFQKLSPEQQHKTLQTLHKLNALPPARQQRVIRRLHAFGKLNPEQRKGLGQVYQQFRTMTPQDKRAFRAAYKRLRALPSAARQQQLAAPALQQRFSPDEIHALSRALALRLPDDLVGHPQP